MTLETSRGRFSAKADTLICPKDQVHVGENSLGLVVVFETNTYLRVDENTHFTIPEPQRKRQSLLDLFKGVIYFFSRQRESLQVNARSKEDAIPFVSAAIEGTAFQVTMGSDRASVVVLEGQVRAYNPFGSIQLASGEVAIATVGNPPVREITIRPDDAVQWTLYYPPVFGGDTNRLPVSLQRAAWFLNRGDVREAFDALRQVAPAQRDEKFYVLRASARLRVGRLAGAKEDLARARIKSPDDSDVYTVQTIIDVAQNKRDEALANGRRAVELNPGSAPAKIALSYAYQAQFDLEQAREVLEEAVKLDPRDSLAWARLAEMWLSFGYVERAVDAARKARALAPHAALPNIVVGFASLANFDVAEGIRAFSKAIATDSANPLARLGLGLAQIRQGDLAKGTRDIEIAAALDPTNAVIRSYLGKAYFEDKEGSLASEQYQIAKSLDKADPTPYFYDALLKQTQNKPVEALRDLQTSIELNSNRAVYRSTLLLDRDLASRSASLGRIYQDLGFEQRALFEGWRSVNTDPSDFSGHRFLADTYAVLPRHEFSRVSELLQSLLLQPSNVTPVQPQLGQSDSFILRGTGPAEPAFNEFNNLFERNRLGLQVSGVAGENQTYGDEFVQYGVWNRIGYSIGQFHYQTEGFRENNDQMRNVYNTFGQISLSHDTSLQAEFRYNDFEFGDLPLLFDPNEFSPNLRQREKVFSARLGFRHAFTVGSDLIGSFTYRNTDARFKDGDLLTTQAEGGGDGFLGEIQHLYRSSKLKLISGIGYFNESSRDTFKTRLNLPPPFGFESSAVSNPNEEHTNLYVYSLIDYFENITFTLGGSVDVLRSPSGGREQFNPKVGVTWNVFPDTTIRAAAFRTLQRPNVLARSATPTIEPTQVAGFNQFFFGPIGEDAWRYGVGLDQKIFEDLFVGAEFSTRDLNVPLFFIPPPPAAPSPRLSRADWEEILARAYFYWAPLPRLSLSAQYLYEQFKREDGFFGVELIRELDTHRVPLGVRYFDPLGFFAWFSATYINQSGEFAQPAPGGGFDISPGRDDFWVLDASLGYRIPNQYGLVRLEFRNLLDQDFRFQDTDPANPFVQPGRVILLRATLAF